LIGITNELQNDKEGNTWSDGKNCCEYATINLIDNPTFVSITGTNMKIATLLNKQAHVGKFEFQITREYSDNTNKETFDAELEVKYDCSDYPWEDIKSPPAYLNVGKKIEFIVSKYRVKDVDGLTWSEVCGYGVVSLGGAPPFITVENETTVTIAPTLPAHAGEHKI
jgi:hypothetical protein